MQRKINSLVIIGVVGTCVFGSHFAAQVGRSFLGNRDIWWTPKIMALSLDETRQDFEILLRGELLQGYLGRGALSAADADGSTYLVTPPGYRHPSQQLAQGQCLSASSGTAHTISPGRCRRLYG
ncbi:MAG TPA: hypothetical protein ENN29_11765, partial [Candidatus Hydrogenedentes bacterium]|nr:hypothetical protein [Candidatus Hydrogenedentota bacterium]